MQKEVQIPNIYRYTLYKKLFNCLVAYKNVNQVLATFIVNLVFSLLQRSKITVGGVVELNDKMLVLTHLKAKSYVIKKLKYVVLQIAELFSTKKFSELTNKYKIDINDVKYAKTRLRKQHTLIQEFEQFLQEQTKTNKPKPKPQLPQSSLVTTNSSQGASSRTHVQVLASKQDSSDDFDSFDKKLKEFSKQVFTLLTSLAENRLDLETVHKRILQLVPIQQTIVKNSKPIIQITPNLIAETIVTMVNMALDVTSLLYLFSQEGAIDEKDYREAQKMLSRIIAINNLYQTQL